MEWQKRGVLVPTPLSAPWSISHAALPIVRETHQGVEIFFSTRDAAGHSHVARASFNSHLTGEPHLEASALLNPGALGAFDDAGVTTGCLVDSEDVLFLYYSGWTRGLSVPFYFFIGCATSEDGGRTFTRVSPSPILERTEVDPYLTASPWILVEHGLWRMWYVSGIGWDLHNGTPRHRYHIKYAESQDGLVWQRGGHVCIALRNDEYAIGRPCVIRDETGYRMWYSYRGDAYRIGYAESVDGLEWERKDDEAGIRPSEQGWDSEMIEYPCVFEHGAEWYMLYNGNGYGATGIGLAVRAP